MLILRSEFFQNLKRSVYIPLSRNLEEEPDEDGVQWGSRDEVVGWDRTVLLKEVVVVLGRQRDLQRLTVPYAKALGVLDGMESEGNVMITDG